ncbi:Integrin alpha-D [Gossypium arboreum]|uniref:Integrin alpha-D n=1 Tax=Gossypium arboreum TaxID=29729 RepID=A0A0B0NU56_GOSAR|nr:Integrin alpha-D [Gossypium arboreum]
MSLGYYVMRSGTGPIRPTACVSRPIDGSRWFIGYVNDENRYEIIMRWYSVTKLARVRGHRRSHHTIKLSFWVSMILNILSIWHV